MTGMDVMQDILDKGLPPRTTNLAQLIDAFVQQHPQYADQREAWGQCDAASYKFISFAHEHGYTGELATYTFYADATEASVFGSGDTSNMPNPDPETYVVFDDQRNILKNEAGFGMCTWHCIVDAGHILIDFTARQYHTHYAYPHIIAIEDRAMAAKAGA